MNETETTTRWTAGWNMPGYSPDPDNVADFDTWEDARSYIAYYIDRAWDMDAEGQDADDDESADARWLEVHTRIGLAIRDQEWSHFTGDQSVALWIVRAEA